MNGIKGLALGFGLAALMVVGLACGAEEKQAPASESPQAEARPGSSGSPGEKTPPVIPGGAPRATLSYDGTAYYPDPLSTDEAANLDEDDLELVGSTTESNLIAPGSGKSLRIYRLKVGEAGTVYMLDSLVTRPV